MVWPLGRVNVSAQPLTALLPVLVTDTAAVSPLFQALTVYVTRHPPDGGGVVGGAVVGGAVVGGAVVGGAVVGGAVVGGAVVGGAVVGGVSPPMLPGTVRSASYQATAIL